MKLVLFDEDFKLGVLKNGTVVDVSALTNGLTYYSPQEMMNQIIQNFDSLQGEIENLADASQGVPISDVRLRAPLPKPTRLVCMAGNYMESGTRSDPGPIAAFNKSNNSVIGNEDTITLPNAPATVFEHEAEFAIVMGKTSANVKPNEAFNHIFGYTNFIDVSCRGIGPAGADNFFIGKSWHTFGPMGPALVTSDEIENAQELPIKLWVQGELRQDYNTNDMAHKIPELIAWVTSITTLEAGDVIACGTNHRGLGPLQHGDTVEIEIGDFGKLTNQVIDTVTPAREWVRETRGQKEAREAS